MHGDRHSLSAQGPFQNIKAFSYWTGTINQLVPDEAFYLSMGTDGFQGSVKLNQELHAWAVHDGDMSPVPALLLFGTGLLGLIGLSKRKAVRLKAA
jgi:hypothetical protein